MTYTIEVTEEELIALRQMLHRACLHSGIDVAGAANHWNMKIAEAMRPVPSKQNGKDVSAELN